MSAPIRPARYKPRPTDTMATASVRPEDTSGTDLDTNTWLEIEALKFGTDNQRERWAAGLLPEPELLTLARAELYQPMGDAKRWRAGREPIKPSDVRHRIDCEGVLIGKPVDEMIRFETTDAAELDHDEWERLKAIKKRAMIMQDHPWMVRSGAKVAVIPRSHWAECVVCDAEVARSSVRVVVPWAGRDLVREYAI